LENLKACVGPRQFSVDSEASLCYNGLPALYNFGFVGKEEFVFFWIKLKIRNIGSGHRIFSADFHWNTAKICSGKNEIRCNLKKKKIEI